jgi:uncharacterized protein (DUF2235 family)
MVNRDSNNGVQLAKNILIFSDGTGQAGGLKPDQHLSNVYKLYRATRNGPDNCINPSEQVAFYDAGLGTERDEGRIHIRALQTIRKFISAAVGIGLSRNIADCYEAILKHYEPGDRIFLFGFSRGAYTARCVAGVLNLCGVPTRSADGACIPRYGSDLRAIAEEAVGKVYEHGAGRDRAQFEPEREEQARRFRSKYGSDLNGQANEAPYFIGVFDTVAALGAKGLKRFAMNLGILVCTLAISAAAAGAAALVGADFRSAFIAILVILLIAIAVIGLMSSIKVIRDYPQPGEIQWHLAGWHSAFYDRFLDKRVRYARQALAIDETRADFPRVQWGIKGDHPPRDEDEPEWFEQIWFAGCHSDVGGSYAEDESRLSDVTLAWMVEQAASLSHPIIVDRTKLYLFPSAAGMQHSEVEAVRDLYPRWVPKRWRFTWKESPRIEVQGATLHPSVLERFKLPAVLHCGETRPYRPETLRNDPRFSQFYTATS